MGQEEWDKKDDICFSTLMKALIRNQKTKRMVEAGKFEHAYEIMRVLERRYNTHNQAAKSALTLAFHSIKREPHESGDEYLDRLNITALKLEKAGEPVTDTAKLTRLMQSNAGDGSMYDKLGLTTIYSIPHIDFDQAAGLFEGL